MQRNGFLFSLRFKLLITSISVEVFMLALLVCNSTRLITDHLTAQTDAHIEELRPLLNAALAAPMAQRDYVTVQEILRESQNANGLHYLRVLNSEGVWVAEQGAVPLRESAPTPNLLHHTILIETAGQRYGELQFGFSTAFMTQARSQLLNQSLLIAGMEIAISIGLLAFIGFLLTRHLVRLTSASEAIARGNFKMTLPVGSRDEVGHLSQTFNTMSAGIQYRIESLHEAMSSLAAADAAKIIYMEALEEEHSRLIGLLAAMNLGVLFVDMEGKIEYCNPLFSRIWMISDDVKLSGQSMLHLLNHSKGILSQPDHFSQHLFDVQDTRPLSDSFEFKMTDGRVIKELSVVVSDTVGHAIGRLWMYEDVTRERQASEQLIYMAERDALTGLLNRRRIYEELGRLMEEGRRNRNCGAMLFFDLDDFKYVNDTFGHSAGDALLTRISGELSTLVRKGELLARIGGDEFAILVHDCGVENIEVLAERVVRAIANIPFRFAGIDIRVTSSLGYALYPKHADNAEDLITCADAAMYQAKDAGKNAWREYRPDLDASREMMTRLGWNERIDRAIDNGLLRLHFQGIYDASTLALKHLEALVRMVDEQDPTRLIPPGNFIPFAEKSGKILAIDRWVLNESIALLARNPGMVPMAVNISGRSFDDHTLPLFIADLLAQQGVEPQRLLIELTETAAVSDLQDAVLFINALHRTGCETCLDDFGAGFSSFAYLKYLKVGVLKIDGLFVRNLPQDRDNQVFIQAIVHVAHGLGKRTVAEFVEDAETLQMLLALGVDMVQGYHIDKPQALHPGLGVLKPN